MKKGFTLVELLAVIIILGVLSLLIVPKVINTLNDSEEKTNMASAEGLLKAAEYKYQDNEIKGISESIKVDYTNNINIDKLDFNGKKPEKGEVKINKNGKVSMAVKIGNNCYMKRIHEHDISVIPYDSETCVAKGLYLVRDADGNGVPSLGDEYAIGDEHFYLIRTVETEYPEGMEISDEQIENKAIFLAKYNLDVGYETECSEENSIIRCTSLSAVPTTDPKYGIQDVNAKGMNNDTNPTTYKGVVPFSEETYWLREGLLHYYPYDDYPATIYEGRSTPYRYIEQYVDYLKELGGPSSTTGRLLNIEDLDELGFNFVGESSENIQPWVYSTSYWTGVASESEMIYAINAYYKQIMNRYGAQTPYHTTDDRYGVRPVIEIDLSEF